MEEVPQVAPEHGVEPDRRLVEHEDLRLAEQCRGERHARALAAGEAVDDAPLEAAEPDCLDRVLDALRRRVEHASRSRRGSRGRRDRRTRTGPASRRRRESAAHESLPEARARRPTRRRRSELRRSLASASSCRSRSARAGRSRVPVATSSGDLAARSLHRARRGDSGPRSPWRSRLASWRTRRVRLRAVAPFFSRADVERAVSPDEAYDAVREGVRRVRPWRVDDAAEALRDELPGRRLPRDARSRRRPRAAQVGDLVPRQSRSRAADGDRARRSSTTRRRASWRQCSTPAAVTALRTGAAAVLAAATLGRGRLDRRRRLRRQRRRDGADVRRPRARSVGLGRRHRTRSSRRRRGRCHGRPVAGGSARRRRRRHGHAGQGDPLPRRIAARGPARLADGRRRARQGRDRSRGARPLAPVLRRLGAGRHTGASSQPQ